MFCRNCGARNDDNAYRCVQCGDALQFASGPAAVAEVIPNYLAQAILLTLFCCMPFGIVAIIFSAQVNGKLQAGDIEGARAVSNKAKMWCWIAFGVGVPVVIITMTLQIIGIIAQMPK